MVVSIQSTVKESYRNKSQMNRAKIKMINKVTIVVLIQHIEIVSIQSQYQYEYSVMFP